MACVAGGPAQGGVPQAPLSAYGSVGPARNGTVAAGRVGGFVRSRPGPGRSLPSRGSALAWNQVASPWWGPPAVRRERKVAPEAPGYYRQRTRRREREETLPGFSGAIPPGGRAVTGCAPATARLHPEGRAERSPTPWERPTPRRSRRGAEPAGGRSRGRFRGPRRSRTCAPCRWSSTGPDGSVPACRRGRCKSR